MTQGTLLLYARYMCRDAHTDLKEAQNRNVIRARKQEVNRDLQPPDVSSGQIAKPTVMEKRMKVPVRLSRISLVAAIVMLSGLVVAPLAAQAAPQHRGMESLVASHSAEGVRAQPLVPQPLSWDHCDGVVCTSVVGGGLYLSAWSTTAENHSYRCTSAHFWIDGVIAYTSGQQCGSSKFRSTWMVNRYFDNGSLVCNTWDGFAGQPCGPIWTNQ
jgi:hypothetical protein